MAEGHDPLERRLSREDLLRVAAAVGGAGLLAGRAGIADAARTQLLKESGRLKVLDWAGYENDGGQPLFAAYVKAHPKNKPQFSYMTNEADALANIRAGQKPDQFRPYVGWVKYFATSGLVQPWEPELDHAFASGDVWIAPGWPNDWVEMKKKKLKVVYMHPKEKPIAWVGMFMLLKDSPRFHLAHDYVDAWSSAKSGKWLEDNYGYGHANTLARPA